MPTPPNPPAAGPPIGRAMRGSIGRRRLRVALAVGVLGLAVSCSGAPGGAAPEVSVTAGVSSAPVVATPDPATSATISPGADATVVRSTISPPANSTSRQPEHPSATHRATTGTAHDPTTPATPATTLTTLTTPATPAVTSTAGTSHRTTQRPPTTAPPPSSTASGPSTGPSTGPSGGPTTGPSTSGRPPGTGAATGGPQLPGGGRVMFPGRRLVALYGNPYAPGLGALGQQGLTAAIARAKQVAGQYDGLSSVPVVPTFEIIATVATAGPGPDGDYSAESTVADLRPWVQAAGKAGMYVVLDLQVGRASVLDQAKLYTGLLTLPYVGLAIDPEWKLGPDQYPLRQIGSVTATEVNQVIHWLAGLTAAHHLPQKLLVLHQFRIAMLQDEAHIDTGSAQVAVLIHMDGQGSPGAKDATWTQVVAAAPPGVSFGWKNFYAMDTRTLTPAETMAHDPKPLMISYQ